MSNSRPERAACPGGALLEQLARPADVLGGEEDRQPAVRDLAGELRVLRPDRGDVDRDPLLDRRDRELQRLAGPVGQRQLVGLAGVGEPLARERLPQDLHVLARALELLAEALPVPALGHLRARRADAEQHAPARELVERGRGHGGHRRRAPRHLEDRRADPDALGLRGQPGEHGGGVGPVGLGGPDRVEPRRLRLPHQLELVGGRHAEAPVADVQPEPHCKCPFAGCIVLPAGRSYVTAHATPPRPRPTNRHRLPSARDAQGHAHGRGGEPDHRRRLHGPEGRRVPDARRAPQRRPHEPRQLRPRLGPLHRRARPGRARPPTASCTRSPRCSRRASRWTSCRPSRTWHARSGS